MVELLVSGDFSRVSMVMTGLVLSGKSIKIIRDLKAWLKGGGHPEQKKNGVKDCLNAVL
ncbi:hypothetical protein MASR2M44_23310 [Bacteroidota bacterium]